MQAPRTAHFCVGKSPQHPNSECAERFAVDLGQRGYALQEGKLVWGPPGANFQKGEGMLSCYSKLAAPGPLELNFHRRGSCVGTIAFAGASSSHSLLAGSAGNEVSPEYPIAVNKIGELVDGAAVRLSEAPPRNPLTHCLLLANRLAPCTVMEGSRGTCTLGATDGAGRGFVPALLGPRRSCLLRSTRNQRLTKPLGARSIELRAAPEGRTDVMIEVCP